MFDNELFINELFANEQFENEQSAAEAGYFGRFVLKKEKGEEVISDEEI